MRAIDIEGLDEEIRCEICRNPMHTSRGCDGNCKYDEKLYERIMQILSKRINPLPSVQPERKTGWIPCSERLPGENGRYLVTRGVNACGSLWNRNYIANYSDLMGIKSERIWWQGNVGKSDFERIDDVLAWMPLPEPYREDGETDG